MVATFTTSGAVLLKAGAFIDPWFSGAATLYGITPDEALTQFINEAESTINVTTRHNWTNSYPTLNTDVKMILSETASAFAAIPVISYNMSGLSRIEAEDRVNIMRDVGLRGLSILRDKKPQDFIDGA